jgi:PqqD family protein of HPr-rel-A system
LRLGETGIIFTLMRVEKSSQTVFTPLEDGTAVLLNLNTLFYYGLNRTGAALWQQIEESGGLTLDELARAVCERFDIEDQAARQAIHDFLDQLEQYKLVQID